MKAVVNGKTETMIAAIVPMKVARWIRFFSFYLEWNVGDPVRKVESKVWLK